MNTVKILNGHVLDHLRELPENSVHCVITSPPYWGLRDYGIEPIVWGGEAGCEHEWNEFNGRTYEKGQGREYMAKCWKTGGKPKAGKTELRNGMENKQAFCILCGAWLGSYGLEPTIELYVQHTVEIFRKLRRVLRQDGVCFLNLGDSYAGGGRAGKDGMAYGGLEAQNRCNAKVKWGPPTGKISGLKPKDLCGIPWRVALALQADGWWLRSDIIWSKPNPMPESVTDRPTRSHEYIFLLTKSAKYFWDQDAVREPNLLVSEKRVNYGLKHKHPDNIGVAIPPVNIDKMGERFCNPSGRNLRSVWNIATHSFPEAHFATFPPELVEKCIKAGAPEGGTVLDIFMGSGTTCLVAAKMQRDSIGIELKPEYVQMAKKRIKGELGFLVEII